MGGGDLNLKKSWHPNTMKNQERVWKAEQAAAQEQKRIQELQHERAVERDRAELNSLVKQGAGGGDNDDRLRWMYDKPDKKAHHEDYLLGKAIEKNYDQPEKTDDVIPAVARRIVGSSMMTMAGDSQVDLARKMREDPLLLVKERERAARAALLSNPIHRKRLTELLRKEQEEKKDKKEKKPKKKDNLDNALAAKLNALGGDTGVDIAALLASDDSSSTSDCSEEESTKKKKRKKKKCEKTKIKKSKKRTKAKESDSDSSGDEKLTKKYRDLRKSKETKPGKEHKREHQSPERNSRQHLIKNKDKSFRENIKQRSDSMSSDKGTKNKRVRRDSPVGRYYEGDDSQRARRIRNQSKDFDKQTRNRRNRTDSSSDRKQRDFSGRSRRSGSRDSDGGSKSFKVGRQNDDRQYGKPVSDQRRDIREDRRYERKPRRSPEQNRSTKLDEQRRRSPVQSKSREEEKSKSKKNVLSAEERAAKLAEMAAAGVEREVQRGLRVAAQLAQQHLEEKAPRKPRMTHNEARALPDSLESRIHSNRHYIQRDKKHMNEHFARR